MYVHFDGVPSHHLPLLLTAFQHRFARDLETLSQHLIDDVRVGWEELGTDLLAGAPPELASALTGGDEWPGRTLDHLLTPDGSPPVRMTVTDQDALAQDMQWGYVLHPHGIEVISVQHEERGRVIGWDTDPRAAFNDHPLSWSPSAPPTVASPARSRPTPAQRAAARR
ncbi:hypothetical protein [Streptomyces sp. NPDC005004]